LYHKGEIEVQTRAGVRDAADRVLRGVRPTVPFVARHFLGTQRMAVISSIDERGRVWATLLTGKPGFISAPVDLRVRVEAKPIASDPLRDSLHVGASVGVLVIDFARKMRMRINGTVARETSSDFEMETREVYPNCAKYIHARALESCEDDKQKPRLAVVRSVSLSGMQQKSVGVADTFFIASQHPEMGADASHRGGPAGLIRIVDECSILWPDYSGNSMFNTLGNISVNPSAGLLFVDFEGGNTLQLTGKARTRWDVDLAAEFPGAGRVVEFRIEQVIEVTNAFTCRWLVTEQNQRVEILAETQIQGEQT